MAIDGVNGPHVYTGHEALLWGLCEFWGFPVRRASVNDDGGYYISDECGWWCPDFYLLEHQIYIEVREDDAGPGSGNCSGWRQENVTGWRENRPDQPLIVISRPELVKLIAAKNAGEFTAQLRSGLIYDL